MFAYSELGHVLKEHIAYKAVNTKAAEGFFTEAWNTISNKASYILTHPFLMIICAVIIGGGLLVYSVAGKGSGSHAGREEVRRSYRRQLAREMAKDDAAKIRAGEKPRRRWMQW